jgi:glycosyltransferase involved in cell wall biosynthesis
MDLNFNDAPFFSVVIPTFNRSEELFKCLSKLVDQNFKNFEVIVCDDGSTDKTYEIVQLFASKLDLVYLFNENSGGPAKPRNNGIKHSKGTWIALLDSDDLWYDNKLEFIFDLIINNENLDFISHDLIINNNSIKNKVLTCGPVESTEFYKKLLLYGNRFPNSSIVVKKSFISLNNISYNESPKFSSVEDYDFTLKIAKFKGNMVAVNLALGEYTIHKQNISNNVKHLQNLKYLLIFHAYFVQDSVYNKKRFALSLFCRYNIILATYNFKQQNYLLFVKFLFYAIWISPTIFLVYLSKRIVVAYYNFKFLFNFSNLFNKV